ncbi:MAG: arsenite methyltransferase [Planctomycetes bacterium]|nr:arsenite methyltransferase [Planctomycetota bacterium]
MNDSTHQDLKRTVRERYGAAVRGKLAGQGSSCCGSASGASGSCDPITSNLYDATEAGAVPADALAASFGCGNPTALAELRPGEVVLDLGSGGGIDVLLSAKRVAPGGKAYGLDMTDEMLAVARANQAKAGVTNVEFLKGEIEAIPLPDASVDVIVSNCVINLSGDKPRVLAEAFRVLKPGGRFAVSDIVLRRELTGEVRRSMELYTGCIAGALVDADYSKQLAAVGFVDVTITPTREFGRDEAKRMVADAGIRGKEFRACVDSLDGAVYSAFLRATKPR